MVPEPQFKEFMAGVCTPVAVVTTMADGLPHGTTVGSLTSLSLRPPMVTIALDHRSKVLSRVRRAGEFGVNVLGEGQDALALTFATPAADRFDGVEWYPDRGLPRLCDAPGWLTCRLDRFVAGGDHVLLLGLVEHTARTDAAPLVYGNRVFGTHSGFIRRRRSPITDHIAAFAR